jgi:hypothetical protein
VHHNCENFATTHWPTHHQKNKLNQYVITDCVYAGDEFVAIAARISQPVKQPERQKP